MSDKPVPPDNPQPPQGIRPEDTPSWLRSLIVSHTRIGPLPDPSEPKAYNEIIPNGAERIFGWAEDEATHRRRLENSASRRLDRAPIIAAIITCLGLIAAVVLGLNGVIVPAWVIGGVAVLSIPISGVLSLFRRKDDSSNDD